MGVCVCLCVCVLFRAFFLCVVFRVYLGTGEEGVLREQPGFRLV